MGKKILDDFRDFEVCGQTLKSQKYKYFENETFFLQIKTWLTFYIKALWYSKKKFQSDITFTLWLFYLFNFNCDSENLFIIF